MKIDLHCHTKKIKSGDNEKRNVDSKKFVKVLSDNQVKFVAITNHNSFDKKQYYEFRQEALKENIYVWPGIELDVQVNNETGHVIIINNPNTIEDFSKIINQITDNINVDTFNITIDNLLNEIKCLDTIIIVHYLKKHGFSEKSIDIIKNKLDTNQTLMLEPSSLKTVGIMYAHDIIGFIGSDVMDWDKYPREKVPDLKMDIKDYATFKLLVKKDSKTISTFLNQKKVNEIELQPFFSEKDPEKINLKIYEDVNIVFGGKGTGKSKIIEALKEYYLKLGNSSVSYYAGQTKESKYDELVSKKLENSQFDLLNIDDCTNEFNKIKKWKQTKLINTSDFYNGFNAEKNNKNYMLFGFNKAKFLDVINDSIYKTELNKYIDITNSIEKLLEKDIVNYLELKDYQNLTSFLELLKKNVYKSVKEKWINYQSLYLEKFTIEKMKEIALTKTGNQSIPSSTGFANFASELISLKEATRKIIDSMETKHVSKKDFIGIIPEKGNIYVITDIFINPNEAKSIIYSPLKPSSTILKKILNCVKQINLNSYREVLSEHVKDFITHCSVNCNSLKDCYGILVDTYIEKGDKLVNYTPSSGEKSMILLSNALVDTQKDVYILDEPELSVGHKYINEVIVPKLKQLASLNKKIIICTHDANIAIRTLPLMTIYREYKKTFTGNLFTDELIEINSKEKISWTETSMSYLEGGKNAFIERGDSYGI